MSVIDQFNRVVRFYERFRELSHGKLHTVDSENYMDDVHAFFQNCYHLKDWIKNDPAASPAMKSQVETFVTNSSDLSLCADLCNSQKHLVLTKPRSGIAPSQAAKHVNLQVGGDVAILAMRIDIAIGSTVADAFAIATAAVKDWAMYLNQHGYTVQIPPNDPPSPSPVPNTPAIALRLTGHVAALRVERQRSLPSRLADTVGRCLISLGRWLRYLGGDSAA